MNSPLINRLASANRIHVAAEIEGLRKENEALKAKVAELEDELLSLPAPVAPTLDGSPPPGSKDARIAELEQQLDEWAPFVDFGPPPTLD